MSEAKQKQPSRTDWRVANDPKTGREYYYNQKTKETTWNKPLDLATDEERAELERKKRETRKFFDEMERNILRKADPNYVPVDSFDDEELLDFDELPDVAQDLPDSGVLRRRGSIGGIRLVRTISSIDDDIVEMMKHRGVSEEFERVTGRFPSPTRQCKAESKPSRVMEDILDKGTPAEGKTNKPIIKRRNSTGTIYIDTTMSKQDNKATIRCVCAVIRAHMVEAEIEGIAPRRQFETFKDEDFEIDDKRDDSKEEKAARRRVPSLELVVKFFENAFNRSQMESECIIMTLIYVERLVKVTKGRFCIRYDNWRPAVFSCMILSSKVWDDLSMWNVDFSQISPAFNLQRINELELAVLDALDYEVKVPAGEYAKYYFHIRSMIARLGFHDKNSANFGSTVLPLNIEGARRLQLATESYEEAKLNQGVDRRGRCASIHVETPVKAMLSRMYSTGDNISDLQRRVFVGLEQLTHTTHNTADGGVAIGKYKRSKSKY
mmetsp:Transcript_21728/g.31624  ORF Transcript_21728/g.31624 Transcript_21728/m.31624 type:complete len:493 (-) Transcript_21728:23-1501(-)